MPSPQDANASCVASSKARHQRRSRSDIAHHFPLSVSSIIIILLWQRRTIDDASHRKRSHLVLRPAKAANAPRPHVCRHRSQRLRSCLRCCSKRARPLDPSQRILDSSAAESSLTTVAVFALIIGDRISAVIENVNFTVLRARKQLHPDLSQYQFSKSFSTL